MRLEESGGPLFKNRNDKNKNWCKFIVTEEKCINFKNIKLVSFLFYK